MEHPEMGLFLCSELRVGRVKRGSTAGLKEVGRPSMGPALDASDKNGALGLLRRVGPHDGG